MEAIKIQLTETQFALLGEHTRKTLTKDNMWVQSIDTLTDEQLGDLFKFVYGEFTSDYQMAKRQLEKAGVTLALVEMIGADHPFAKFYIDCMTGKPCQHNVIALVLDKPKPGKYYL